MGWAHAFGTALSPFGAPCNRPPWGTLKAVDLRSGEVRLPSGERVAFSYDAFGRRVRKELRDEAGTLQRQVDFLWDGDVLAMDLDSEHGARSFVHAPDRSRRCSRRRAARCSAT